MRIPTSTSRIARRVFQITAAGLLVLALCLGIGMAVFIRHAASTQATVVALIAKPDAEDGTIAYYPQFTFSTSDGSSFTISSNNGTNLPEFKEGRRVRVLYDPTNPSRARIDSFLQLWLLPLIFGSLGIFFVAGDWLVSRFLSGKASDLPAA